MSVNLTQEQFQQLLASIGSSRKGSMTSCKATYNGRKDRETVEAFLTAVQVFKKLENVTDSDALAGLPLILRDEAAVWWQGTKNTVTTWATFEDALRNTFAPKKPVYEIYLEACGTKQSPEVSTDDFVTKKRMLFSELPSDEVLNQKQQLNITYGLLNLKIREKVPIEKVKDFDDLLKQARSAEALLKEKALGEGKKESSVKTTDAYKSDTSVPTRAKKASRCNFCKKLGHVLEECRKRKKTMEAGNGHTDTALPTSSDVKFSCYGCGAPGVYRSNCKICSNKPSDTIEEKGTLGLCAINIQLEMRSRPMVFLEVNGVKGKAYVDTGAKISVASLELYGLLKARGQVFYEEMATVTLADGHARLQRVLVFEANVDLGGRRLQAPFIVLQQSHDNRTLLGIDLMQKAGMILNIAQFTWSYIDQPYQEYELYQERFIMFTQPDVTVPKFANVSQTAVAPKITVAPIDMEREKRPLRQAIVANEAESTKAEGAALPSKIKCSQNKLLFDGYSPRMEYMMRDAIQNIEEADYDLSPHAATLFDDVGLGVIDVTTTMDEVQAAQLDGLLQEFKDISVPPYRLSEQRKQILKTRQKQEMAEEQRKQLVDQSHQTRPAYVEGNMVMVSLHPLSSATKGISAKFAPKRDGPYQIIRHHGPSSYAVADPSNPGVCLGIYHFSALTPYTGPTNELPTPAQPYF